MSKRRNWKKEDFEDISFSPYIQKGTQRQFYAEFAGIITVVENDGRKEGKGFFYTKWYEKGGISYTIHSLRIGEIKWLMRASMTANEDLLLKVAKNEDLNEKAPEEGLADILADAIFRKGGTF